ncbi:MAG: Fic family protein [Chloroflexota bacterium]
MNPKFTITNTMTQGLAQIERARGFLEAAQLSESWVHQMSEQALLLEAHHTTHIEGTRLTLHEAERLLAGESVPDADADDVQELLNYREAFHLVSDYLESGAPITEGLIREIHKRLVANVRGGVALPGEYRLVQNYVANSATGAIIYTPPSPGDVPPLMQELVQWLNTPSDVHPVLMSGVAQFQLVHIHPFVDGNGRTSRLLSTLVLYRAGYDFKRLFTISEYYDRDRTAFYLAIQGVRDRDMDLTGWLDYYVQGLSTQLEEVKERGRLAIQVDARSRDYNLNVRQTEFVRILLGQDSLSIHDYQSIFPDVSRRTLQRDLKGMIDKGVLKSQSGNAQILYYLNSI